MSTWFPKLMGDTNLVTNPRDVQRSDEHRLCSKGNAAEAIQCKQNALNQEREPQNHRAVWVKGDVKDCNSGLGHKAGSPFTR